MCLNRDVLYLNTMKLMPGTYFNFLVVSPIHVSVQYTHTDKMKLFLGPYDEGHIVNVLERDNK